GACSSSSSSRLRPGDAGRRRLLPACRPRFGHTTGPATARFRARTSPLAPSALGTDPQQPARDPMTNREHPMKQILDAILADAPAEEYGTIPVPDSYRGITVHRDEAELFAGRDSSDKDPRESLHLDEVPTPELGP